MIWTNTPPSSTDAFRAATLLWGVSKDALINGGRETRLVQQRWIVYGLLSTRGFTHHQIGEVFDMHASTITYGLQQHLAQTDEEYLENAEALVELHDQLLHGFDPHPNTSEGSYRVFPNEIIGRRHCPNMGGFSDYDQNLNKFIK